MCISLIWSFEDTESVVKAALWMKSSRLLMVFLPFSADVKCHQGSQFRVKWPDRRCVQNSNIWRFRRHLALGHDRIGLGGELYLLPTFLARQLSKWYQQVCHFHHFNLVEFVFQRGRFPRVFGDEFGDKFSDKFGDKVGEEFCENLVPVLVRRKYCVVNRR